MKYWFTNPKSSLLRGPVLVGAAAFCVLLIGVFVYISAIKPQAEQVQRFFESSDKITERPFSFRSRAHMLNALELLITEDTPKDQVLYQLDMAYALLNFGPYISTYECTSDALQHLDRVSQLVMDSSVRAPLSPSSYAHHLLFAISCTSSIENQQNNTRTTMVQELLSKTHVYHDIVHRGAIVGLFVIVVFSALYLIQSRTITAQKEMSDHWKESARRDGLTGILNRRALEEDLPSFIQHHRQHQKPLVLLMCDIDYFKKYNDYWGHLKGDEALKKVVNAMSSILRYEDKMYRYGGEELVLILHETDRVQGRKIAERLLSLVRALTLSNPESPDGTLTISIGCTETYAEAIDVDRLLKRADECMYQAKHKGRNCLICC
ncbi:GGDEF domain-containing protein [Vibrio sinaloensis]|uniref:GGDEF domain-containing protein n=1 Tax=Photobacterium sp. (strain ATCC 43367) TaxID=379097 RepID=UPI00206699F6|nr:GGDEF domain-containing protein [Vibrio sinaloensis]UPQ87448.1 GGDEF domain-containing protein [Vibrio sinaloensis]